MNPALTAILRAVSRLGVTAALALGCGAEPPTPATVGERVALGPFGVTISRASTVPLAEISEGNGDDVGVAVFVELSLPQPELAVAAEIDSLREEEGRIAQSIADLRFTRRNFDDSDLSEELTRVFERREELEAEAYHEEARARLLRGGFRLRDRDEREVSPTGYVREETYETQMRFRDGPPAKPFVMLAASREEASYHLGESPQEWVLLFRLPAPADGLVLRVDNPSPVAGQPRSVALELGPR